MIFIEFALILIIVAGVLSAYLLYMPFYFPKPTGPYAVGMRHYYWIDTARKEPRSTDPAHPYRELMVKAWYPAEASVIHIKATAYAPAILDSEKKESKTVLEMLKLLFSGFYRPIFAYYVPQAPITQHEKQFPTIIFSHGFGVPDDLYTAYCTQLASNGYVVFSINHTYDCSFVDFPDGRRIMQAPSPELKSILEETIWLDMHIETWVSDALFVLDQIKNENHIESSIFYAKLDLAHIGMFGHSLGGSTAIQCCRRDNRIHAACSLDGYLRGIDFNKSFAKPFMLVRGMAGIEQMRNTMTSMFTSQDLPAAQEYLTSRVLTGADEFAKKCGPDSYIINLKQAYHDTFTDLSILKHTGPFPRMYNYFGTGSANGFEMMHMINQYVLAFFDKHLKNSAVDILEPYRVNK